MVATAALSGQQAITDHYPVALRTGAVADKESAVECIRENRTLRKIAPGSFEENGGLFVALTDEDLDYLDSFLDACDACGIPTVVHKREDALRLEPGLNPVRPLVGGDAASTGRELSRTFQCFDHKQIEGVEGLVTITGGKATTLRAMAEAAADRVCAKLGIEVPCRTADTVLAPYPAYYQERGGRR